MEAGQGGSLRFLHTETGRELLADKRPYQACPKARSYAPLGDDTHRVEQRFEAYDGERIHGLGQHLPEDAHAWTVDDQFLLGPDLLVAPVAEAGGRSRSVYLPAGARWTDTATGELHGGGTTLGVPAPLERIPVFVREGSAVTDAFTELTA